MTKLYFESNPIVCPLIHCLYPCRYVEYARKYVNPQMTKEAAEVIESLYVTMRSEAKVGKSMPITARQLESMIRLSQVFGERVYHR